MTITFDPITEFKDAVKYVNDYVSRNPPMSYEACMAFVAEEIAKSVKPRPRTVGMEDLLKASEK